MDVKTMRYDLVYNTKYSGSEKWRARVLRMSDRQVIAMHGRLVSTGGLKNKKI